MIKTHDQYEDALIDLEESQNEHARLEREGEKLETPEESFEMRDRIVVFFRLIRSQKGKIKTYENKFKKKANLDGRKQ